MLKKQLTVLFALVLTFPLAMAVFAQKAPAKPKEARWEGKVQRSSKEQSSLTVRKSGSTLEKSCVYDSSTKWVSQYHGDKKVNDNEAAQTRAAQPVLGGPPAALPVEEIGSNALPARGPPRQGHRGEGRRNPRDSNL